MEITAQDLLIVVDVQNDFCPGGVLPVPEGGQIVDVITRVARKFEHIVLTQDWHPPGHLSFASSHAGRKALDRISTSYGLQTLWPAHCIQGTWGAEFHSSLSVVRAELILRKGYRAEVDSYSAFFENDRTTPTGLAGYLRERALKRIFFAGFAYDFCVGYSALDAVQIGFAAAVLLDACGAIDVDGSLDTIEQRLTSSGVLLLDSEDLEANCTRFTESSDGPQ